MFIIIYHRGGFKRKEIIKQVFPITVTAVTNQNSAEITNYNKANTLAHHLYRFYEGGDK